MIESTARAAWHELEGKLRPFVARRVRSEIDVDDIMQDVFLRMQRGLAGLRDDERFGPWVYQVARSAIIDHQRSASKHRVAQSEGLEDQPLDADEEDHIVQQDVASYLVPFIYMLPSPYREALTLVEIEGLTQKQAAEMLGVSLSGMKSRVQRGREKLRQALEDCCNIALDARGKVIGCERRPDGKLPNGIQTRQYLPLCCEAGDRGPRVPDQLASHPSIWERADLEGPPIWTDRLSRAEVADLARIVSKVERRKLDTLGRSDVPATGPLSEAGRRVREAIERGRGFVVLRGLDAGGLRDERLALSYVVLGLAIGAPVPQNLRGELLTRSADRARDEGFRTDGADIIGHLCLGASAPGRGPRIASSGAIVAEIKRTRPELYRVLFDDFPWRYEEEGAPPVLIRRPLCTAHVGREGEPLVRTFFIPRYLRASQAMVDGPRLRPIQLAAIDEIERLADDPRFHWEVPLDPGDTAWVDNGAILQRCSREAGLRLWLSSV